MVNIEWKWKVLYLSGVVPLFLLVFAGSGSHGGGELEHLFIAFLVAIGAVFVISLPLIFGLLFFKNAKYLRFSSLIPLFVTLVFMVVLLLRF
jgi:hypothetical protein